MPAEFQKPPTDADLILVTHGHFDHSSSAPAILAASTKPDCKIVTIKEIGQYYQTKCQVDPSRIQFMNKSGTKDFGWCRVTMVGADHSSSCGVHDGHIWDGGAPAGFVIRSGDYSLYHAGDTGVFLDM